MEERVPQLLAGDHEGLSGLLAELRLALARQNLQSAFDLLDLFWARLAMHIRAENLHLFPTILGTVHSGIAGGKPAADEVTAAIDTLREDHNFFMQQVSASIKSLRAAMAQKPPPPDIYESVSDRIETVSGRLDQHNLLEEGQVYQWPALLLSPVQVERLKDSLRRELDNLPPRFMRP